MIYKLEVGSIIQCEFVYRRKKYRVSCSLLEVNFGGKKTRLSAANNPPKRIRVNYAEINSDDDDDVFDASIPEEQQSGPSQAGPSTGQQRVLFSQPGPTQAGPSTGQQRVLFSQPGQSINQPPPVLIRHRNLQFAEDNDEDVLEELSVNQVLEMGEKNLFPKKSYIIGIFKL